jgi:conjugative relaxase-like TrwC/TraI family protein
MGAAMLTIHRLRADRASYYLSDLSREMPPTQTGPRRAGQWAGAAAARLGLVGPVDEARFEALLHGRHPETDRQLRGAQATVMAFDLTFSAPKSVSVLFGLGGSEVARQVLDGHTEAVRGALDYLDAHAVTAQRREIEDGVLATSGLAAGAFTHGVNRNVDPHLHTHVVVANLVHGEDGRWGALDQRAIWAHQRAAAAVYESQLRHELTGRLGLHWTQAPFVSGEIKEVSPVLLGEFSSRAADIRRHGHEHGVRSSRGTRVAAAATRPGKGEGMDFDDLVPRWHERATAALGAAPELAPALGHHPPGPDTLSEHQFAGVLSIAADGQARRRDVVTAFAHAARQGTTVANIEALTELSLPGSAIRLGVAETSYPTARVIPAPHLLRALGSRPLDATQHAVWLEGGLAIDAYRQRWQVRDAETLGHAQCQPGWSTARLVDHLRTVERVGAARARLGLREPLTVELGRGR